MTWLIAVALHLDVYLNQWAGFLGPWIYVVLFVVIFCETGLVVTPFLPGDSLLFAMGALASLENSAVDPKILIGILTLAAVMGDAANYAVGRYLGPKVFFQQQGRWLNRKHLERTERFYKKHGGKTIIIARFAPIIRTFAPFVAGMGQMHYPRFFYFNVIGGTAWVFIFILAGYFFGNIPAIKSHFHIVIFAIIFLSLIPVVVEYGRALRDKKQLN